MAEPFIKLYKKMLKWEWYDNENTCRMFIHCLLRANWEATKWHGIEIEAGQFITSLPSLADELHLTTQQVRTALSHLKSTGEITDKGYSKYRIITVNNWGMYQGSNRQSNRQSTDNQQTTNRQSTADKEYKDIKEEKKHIYGEYSHIKLTDKERDRLFADYGESQTLEAIKYLDEYKERKGYTSKNDNLTLRKWVFDAVKKDKGQDHNKKIHNYNEREYDYKEMERIAKG